MSDQTENLPEKPPFDPVAMIRELRATEPPRGGPKLNKTEQCQALAILRVGYFSHAVVEKMFGVSSTTVSHIAHCIDRRPGTIWRYPAVFVEWRRLGEDGFIRTYMTEDLYLKAKRLKYEIPELLDDKTMRGPNPRSDGHSHSHIGYFEVSDWLARVDWVECDPETPAELCGPIGWRYATEGKSGLSPYISRDPTENEPRYMPWPTSGEAFDAAFHAIDATSPRLGRRAKR